MEQRGKSLIRASDGFVDIDLRVLLKHLLASWRFILICLVVAEVITACSLRNAAPSYQAEMVVSPIQGDTPTAQSFTSRVLNAFTSASVGGSQQFDEFQYKLTSPSVVRAANRDGQLYTWLYGNAWNPETRTFQKPGGLSQWARGLIRQFFNRPEWYPPDEVLTSQMLREQIVAEPVPSSTLTRVTYENENPAVAVDVLRRLFLEADRELRSEQRARLKAQIANANEMMASTQVADYREALAQSMASAQFKLMNVPDSIDYSAHNVEAPFVSPVPISPRPALTLAMVFIGTLAVSAFVGVGYRILRDGKKPRSKALALADKII